MVLFNYGYEEYVRKVGDNTAKVVFNVIGSDTTFVPTTSLNGASLFNTPAGVDSSPTISESTLTLQVTGALGPDTETQTGSGSVDNYAVVVSNDKGYAARNIEEISYDSSNITKNIIGITSVQFRRGN